MTDIDEMLTGEMTLTPLVCTFCESFVTYIEFDLVLHLSEAHQIGRGRGYLDTPPTPYTPSRRWLDDYRIRDAISEGKALGIELDDNSLEKLGREYQAKVKVEAPSQGILSFKPIVSVDEFLKDSDKPYSALRNHTLQQSPCFPIIGVKPGAPTYCCEICRPKFVSIHLSSIEHHCKYRQPERHKAEILSKSQSSSTQGEIMK